LDSLNHELGKVPANTGNTEVAGHSNISTTRNYYLAIRPEDIASANQVINKIMAGVKYD
jgi:hypothetical protein